MIEPYYSDKYTTIYKGGCLNILPEIERISAVVTDPPYELGFMGKSWDSKGVSFRSATWKAIRESCLPGAPLLSFGGSRTQHRIACAIEDAGWELRDVLMWVYGSGFPKSLDISKAIDKSAGVERVVVGVKPYTSDASIKGNNYNAGGYNRIQEFITESSTEDGKRWEGYGTALKPAYEPIILAMNPLDGTFANNALKHGVAGLNIDGCRVPLNDESAPSGSAKRVFASNQFTEDKVYGDNKVTPPQGRFPANFLHDGSEEVVGLFPNSKTNRVEKPCPEPEIDGHRWRTMQSNRPARGYDENGSAARFFYCAKASRLERDAGLDCMPLATNQEHEGRTGQNNSPVRPDGSERHPIQHRNNHPTVKPLALMTYLCKLVKMPEYNLVLDPFCGSGTTLLACASLGIKSIGIDSDEKSCEIAANRCIAQTLDMLQKGEY